MRDPFESRFERRLIWRDISPYIKIRTSFTSTLLYLQMIVLKRLVDEFERCSCIRVCLSRFSLFNDPLYTSKSDLVWWKWLFWRYKKEILGKFSWILFYCIYIYIYRLRVNLRERCKKYFEKAIISLKWKIKNLWGEHKWHISNTL